MALLGTLQVRLGLDSGVFAQKLGKFSRDVKSQTDGLAKGFTGLSKFKGVFAGLTAGLSAAAFTSMIRGATDTLDAMGELAQRLGLATGKLQEYRITAKFAGVESQGLDKSLGFLARNLGNIRNGLDTSGKKAGILESLGLSQRDIQGADVGTVFEKVVDGLSRIEDPATRSATAIALFGKSAGELGILFEQGLPGLEKSRQLITDLGIGLTDLDTARAGALNDNFDKLGLVLDGVKNKLVSELSPAVIRLTDDFLRAGTEGQNLGQRIASGVQIAAVVLDKLIAAGRLIGNIFTAGFQLIQAGAAGAAAGVTLLASAVVDGIGTKAPAAFNSLLQATEDGLTRMKQGFADFATAAANFVVASMNKAIEAIEKLVNFSAQALNGLITAVNQVAGTNFGTIGAVSLGRAGSFDRFPVDGVSLGRVDGFGAGAAESLRGISDEYAAYAQSLLPGVGTDVRQGVEAAGDLFSLEGGNLSKSLEEAVGYANQLTGALGGDPAGGEASGGGGGGKSGGAAGAMKNLADASKKTAEEMQASGLKVQNVWEQAMGSISSAIDEFVKTGKLDFRSLVDSIIADLASAALKNAINSAFSAITGSFGGSAGGTTGTVAAIFQGIGSFEGGGYTGTGPRTGGVDGRGGRFAVVHPNETVIDHERVRSGARGSRGRPQVNLSVPITLQPGVSREELARVMPLLKRDIIDTIPALIARGGRYASAFGQ